MQEGIIYMISLSALTDGNWSANSQDVTVTVHGRPLFVIAGQSNAARLNISNSLQDYIALIDAGVIAHNQHTMAPIKGENDWYPFEDIGSRNRRAI